MFDLRQLLSFISSFCCSFTNLHSLSCPCKQQVLLQPDHINKVLNVLVEKRAVSVQSNPLMKRKVITIL